jgi:hypothetical protein
MNNISPLKTVSGFTLIEVLVASVILFSSISVISLIYKGAYLTSVKASAHMAVSGAIPIILTKVEDAIRAEGDTSSLQLTGDGIVWGVQYSWQAELQQFKAAPNLFDPDSGKDVETPKKYKLWQVDLSVRHKSLKQSYKYNELSWNEK